MLKYLAVSIAILSLLWIVSVRDRGLEVPPTTYDFIEEVIYTLPDTINGVDEVDTSVGQENRSEGNLEAINTIPDVVKCQCVTYARTQGMNIPYPTNADELEPNGKPDIGNGILFDYSGIRHLAVITDITKDGWKITESNKERCKITERIVDWNDNNIIGFVQG